MSIVHANRGVALVALGRYEEALAAFDTALELDPRDLTALNDKGLLLSRMGRDEEAMAILDKVREQARRETYTRRVW